MCCCLGVSWLESWSRGKGRWAGLDEKKRKKRKTTQAAKISSRWIKERGPLGKKSPFTRKQSLRIRRVAGGQASRPLRIGLKVRRMLKRTSGLDKLMSLVQNEHGAWEQVSWLFVNQGWDSSEELLVTKVWGMWKTPPTPTILVREWHEVTSLVQLSYKFSYN